MDEILQNYYNCASELGLKTQYFDDLELLRISLGKKQYFFTPVTPTFNNTTSSYISRNKYLVNKLLRLNGVNVNPVIFVLRETFNVNNPVDCSTLKFPLIAKPIKRRYNSHDTLYNIRTSEQLTEFLTERFKTQKVMIVEEFYRDLKEYRVLIFKQQVIAVVERLAAQVIGDGTLSILQLIENYNRQKTTRALIKIDSECQYCLKEQGYTLESVPPSGTPVQLRYSTDIALGGRVRAIDSNINSINADYLQRAASILDLNLVGLDVLCYDINTPFTQSQAMILDAHHSPDLRLHEAPDEGPAVDVTKTLLLSLVRQHPIAYRLLKVKQYLTRAKPHESQHRLLS